MCKIYVSPIVRMTENSSVITITSAQRSPKVYEIQVCRVNGSPNKNSDFSFLSMTNVLKK